METNNNAKYEPKMDNMRQVIIGMLKNRIDKAREYGDSKISIGIHDAAFLLTVLTYHWNSESSKKKSEDK